QPPCLSSLTLSRRFSCSLLHARLVPLPKLSHSPTAQSRSTSVLPLDHHRTWSCERLQRSLPRTSPNPSSSTISPAPRQRLLRPSLLRQNPTATRSPRPSAPSSLSRKCRRWPSTPSKTSHTSSSLPPFPLASR